jgi:PPOX class probable F420-dependent enzyme
VKVTEARRRFSAERVARLATTDASGHPHLVPIVFAVSGETIYSAVDAKPKRSMALRRLANVAANPQVAILLDDPTVARSFGRTGSGSRGSARR